MTPPPGSMRTGRARRRCSPPSRARFAVAFLSRYPESERAGQIGGGRAPMTSVGLVMWDRSASSVGVERGGGGGDRVEGGLGVDREGLLPQRVAEAGVGLPMLMTKSRHTSLASLWNAAAPGRTGPRTPAPELLWSASRKARPVAGEVGVQPWRVV